MEEQLSHVDHSLLPLAAGARLTLDPDAGVSAWVWLSQRCAPGSEAAGVSSSGFHDFGDSLKHPGFQGGVPGVLPTQHHQEHFLMRLSTPLCMLMGWRFGFSRCNLAATEWTDNKVLLSGRGCYIQCPVIKHSGRVWKSIHVSFYFPVYPFY